MNISFQRNVLGTYRLESGWIVKAVRVVAVAIALCAVSACSSTPTKNGSATLQAIPAPASSRPDGSVRVDTQSQEVAKLWASAERARADDKLTIALELLYEALEIDPENGLLWSRAAEIQLDDIKPELAESYATRSNAWAGENNSLLYRNWLIIKHARSMRGDLLGVRGAQKQAQLYQYR